MQVIIPLAGLGTRLRPHTFSKPKCLVPCAGKPVLGHILDLLPPDTVEEVIFIVGQMGDQVEKYVAQNYPMQARYVTQHEPRGQAHAIQLTRDMVDGPVAIVFSDTIVDVDLRPLSAVTTDGVIFVKEVDDPRRFGVVVVGNDGTITRFVEKPTTPVSNLAVVGVYYIREARRLFDAIDELIERNIQTKGEFFLADALQLMVEKGARLTATAVSVWEDCGTVDALLATNRFLLQSSGNGGAAASADTVVIPPVFIHPTATVENSVVGPHVSIGANVTVRHAIVRDSIVDDDSTVANVMLEQSLVGRRANIRGRYHRVNIGDIADLDIS